MMRVLFVNSVCGIRSTGRICTDLAELLNQHGIESLIGYGRECVPERYKGKSIRIGNEIDVKLHALESRLFDNTGFASKTVTKRFIKKISEYNPDIIHIHNVHGYYINVDIFFSYLKNCQKKIVWTLHDAWPFTGHCAYFERVSCYKWKTKCYNCPQKTKYPSSILFDNSSANYEKKYCLFSGIPDMTIVSPSKWLANYVKESFLKEYSLRIIPNGIDTDIFTPQDDTEAIKRKYGAYGKKIVLGVSSAWSREKGLDDFVKMSSIIGDDWRIMLVGLDKKQMRKLPPNIIGIQRTNSPIQLAELYSASDVFFNPTYDDNYPTVNLEARACGTPIITYNTGGSPESAGPNAVVIDKGDLTAAVRTIPLCKKNYEDDISSLSYKTRLREYLQVYGIE